LSDPILWGQLTLQIILIALNAIFACSEVAIISLNEKKLEKLADDGNKKALKILRMVRNPDKFLSAIHVCITFAGFLGAAFAARNLAARLSSWLYYDLNFVSLGHVSLESICIILITLLLSYFTLIFGVLVPKRLALNNPEKTAFMLFGLISFVSVIFRPIVLMLSFSTNIMLKLFRIDPNKTDDEVTEEEIMQMVESSEEGGNIESSEKEMIENIFEFNNTTASAIMTHRTEMTAISIYDSFENIKKTIETTGFSRFPVYKEDVDNIVGILNTRKFLINISLDDPKPIDEIIYTPNFVPESVRADQLFKNMQEKKVHMSIVLDEYGGTSGLVTMEDLIEQIVGNIYDETDLPEEDDDIEVITSTLFRIRGSTALSKIEEELCIDFSEDDDGLETLSGLIFSRFSTIPSDGETPKITVDNLNITVEEIIDHRVVSATVEIISEDIDDQDQTDDD
jgi:putative hemolysin